MLALVNPLIIIWQNMFTIAVGLIGLTFLVTFHEFGHFLFCKLFKIHTPSFSIGLGPYLYSKKIGDTVFALSAIPAGGYVEIAGAAEVGQGDQAHANRKDKYSFASKPFYQKLLVMSGGILANLLFAYIAIIAVCWAGLPQSPLAYPENGTTTIQTIYENSAAAQSGLQVGDTITAFNEEAVGNNPQRLIDLIRSHPNQHVTVRVQRAGQEQTIPVTIGEKQSQGMLGVGYTLVNGPKLSFFEAIKQGIKMTNDRIVGTLYAFKHMFGKRDFSGLVGPIGIISIASEGAAAGIKVLLLLLAIISINLALLNLLPLPILDGGQVLFYTIEAIIGRPLPTRVREYIHLATWLLLIGLLLYISTKDIFRIASSCAEYVSKAVTKD
jgi:regulator of sigma E protease